MPKPNSQTMVVRLPVEVAESLAKLRAEKNLATIGSALKYWVDEQIQQERELELSGIQKAVENTQRDVQRLYKYMSDTVEIAELLKKLVGLKTLKRTKGKKSKSLSIEEHIT